MTFPNEKSSAFNLEDALEKVGGDMEIFREIIEVFLESYPDQLREIRRAIEDSDAGLVERTSHTLKGSVGTFAAKKAYETALRLEIIGREGRLEEAPREYSKLEQELNELDAALKEILTE